MNNKQNKIKSIAEETMGKEKYKYTLGSLCAYQQYSPLASRGANNTITINTLFDLCAFLKTFSVHLRSWLESVLLEV